MVKDVSLPWKYKVKAVFVKGGIHLKLYYYPRIINYYRLRVRVDSFRQNGEQFPHNATTFSCAYGVTQARNQGMHQDV